MTAAPPLAVSAPAVSAPQSVPLPAPQPAPLPAPIAQGAGQGVNQDAGQGAGEPPWRVAAATTPEAYRQDGALHLYDAYRERVFKGKMPPLLYAIGVLNVAIDARGSVRRLDWMRAPQHAPQVVAEIERMVRAAAPFPVPVHMGGVIYTDVWLWDKSGRFQLDTLTEGQLAVQPASSTPSATREPARSSPVKPIVKRTAPGQTR
jgi:hypothetical protein